MDYRALQCFVALADELHFGRAAKKANISQSGLSGQIRRLEERLGGALFDRTTRSVALTAEGRRFLEFSRQALDLLDEGLREFRNAQRQNRQRIVVGLTNICAQWGIHRFISAFSNANPGVVVDTREITSVEQEQALASGVLDVGFLHPPVAEDLALTVIGHEDLCAAVHKDHALSGKDKLSVLDLEDERIVLFPQDKGPKLYAEITNALSARDRHPNIVEFAMPFTSAIQAVSAGRGIAIVGASYAGLHADTVSYLPISDLHVRIPVALAWSTSARSPAVSLMRAFAASRA